MTAALIALLSLTVVGIPITLAVDRNARRLTLLGTAFLYGSGLIFFVLLALSVLHIRWSLLSVTMTALALWVVLWGTAVLGRQRAQPRTAVPHWSWLDLVTLWTLIGYACYATVARLWEWDFWAIWGLKARTFLEHGGIDWRFLESSWNLFMHPDYPLLLPLNYDFIALINGEWSDRWLGALMVAYAVAVVLIVRDFAAEEMTPLYAALLTATATTLAVSRYVGLAEGPLIAFGGAAVLFFRRALLFDDAAAWRHGAILLGLAANVKNEGLALGVSVAIALAFLRPKALWRLWPSAAIAAPWLILRGAHVLPTDIVGGSPLSRAIMRVRVVWPMLQLLWHDLVGPWFWIAMILGIVIAPAARRRREAFVLVVTAIQLVFYVGTYFATPHDPRWHIVTSWPRLTMQIALPITFSVLVMLAVSFPGHAEARPDE